MIQFFFLKIQKNTTLGERALGVNQSVKNHFPSVVRSSVTVITSKLINYQKQSQKHFIPLLQKQICQQHSKFYSVVTLQLINENEAFLWRYTGELEVVVTRQANI